MTERPPDGTSIGTPVAARRPKSGLAGFGRSVGIRRLFRTGEGMALAAAAITLRIAYLSPYPAGWDDVDFALALQRFDLSAMQPHFPGYPVYILLGHLFRFWSEDPFRALALLSAVCGGLAVLPLWLLFSRLGSAGVGRLAALLYAAAPEPLLEGLRPTSDALGSLLAITLAWLACVAAVPTAADGAGGASGKSSRRSRAVALIASGAALGLLLGVRVSYAPLALLWLWAAWAWLRDAAADGAKRSRALLTAAASAAAACGICAAWLAALAASEGGVAPFVKLALSFTGGHFTDWGGTYRADAPLAARAAAFAGRQIGAAGLGTVWPGAYGWRWAPTAAAALAAAGGLAALARRLGRPAAARGGFAAQRRRAAFLLMWMAPYLVWAFFAQNIDKPRHILPLLPPLCWLLAAGLRQAAAAAFRRRPKPAPTAPTAAAAPALLTAGAAHNAAAFALAGLLWLAGTAAVALPLAREAHAQEPPVLQLARYVQRSVPPQGSILFTWEEQRVISYVSPEHTVKRLRRWDDLRTELLQTADGRVRVFATNALLEGMDRPVLSWFHPVRVFEGSPWVYPTYHTITLYEADTGLLDAVRAGEEETLWKFRHY